MDLRAGSFHPPTLEVLEPIGVTARLHELGIVVPRWQLRDRTDGVIGVFELAELLAGRDALSLSSALRAAQAHAARLRPAAADAACGGPLLHRVTEVEQQRRPASLVTAQSPDGTETFEGSWVIGADGGGSIVRKCAGIAFEGFTYPERFALISTPYDLGQHGFTDTAYISHPVEWCAVFRLPDLGPPGLWRFLYGCRPDESEEEALADDKVEERLQAVVPKPGRYETRHKTIYRVHQRVAETFRAGRLLLAGDSAHLNNPLGGFGLNSASAGRDEPDRQAGRRSGAANATTSVLDRYVRQRRTVNIEYVQEASIRNKRTLEETDPGHSQATAGRATARPRKRRRSPRRS